MTHQTLTSRRLRCAQVRKRRGHVLQKSEQVVTYKKAFTAPAANMQVTFTFHTQAFYRRSQGKCAICTESTAPTTTTK